MQRLKNNIRQQIEQTARQAFIARGYRACSMQSIAKQVGISVGNIYHYYASKDELFVAIVAPAINALERCFTASRLRTTSPQKIFSEAQYIEETTSLLLETIQPYREELRLLFYESRGTAVERYFEQLLDRFYESGQAYMREVEAEQPETKPDLHPLFIRLDCLTWSSLLKIICAHPELTEAEVHSLVCSYIQFNHAGWERLLMGQ